MKQDFYGSINSNHLEIFVVLHLISSRCSCKGGIWINLGRSAEKHGFLILKTGKKGPFLCLPDSFTIIRVVIDFTYSTLAAELSEESGGSFWKRNHHVSY